MAVKKNANKLMNEEFTNMSESEQIKLLGINEDTFNSSRFKHIARTTVINDLWNGKTNAQKRALIKGV